MAAHFSHSVANVVFKYPCFFVDPCRFAFALLTITRAQNKKRLRSLIGFGRRQAT